MALHQEPGPLDRATFPWDADRPPASRAYNPYVETSPEPEVRVPLDGSLRILILPLAVASPPEASLLPLPTVSDVFLPGQAQELAVERSAYEIERLGLEGSTGWVPDPDRHDIGLGGSQLLALRQFDAPNGVAARVTFGLASGSARECDDEELLCRVRHLKQTACAALWNTEHGLVLTFEVMARRDGGGPWPTTEEALQTAERSLRGVLGTLICELGLDRETSLDGIFGGGLPWLTRSEATQPIADLVRPAAEQIRRERSLAGLYVVIEDSCGDLAADLCRADPVGSAFDAQAAGVVRRWTPMLLASEPVDDGVSVVREDARVVLLDQGSLSIHHGYLGVAKGMVLAVLPVVAFYAQAESDFVELLSSVLDAERGPGVAHRGGTELLEEQLGHVQQVRRQRLRRHALRRQVSVERFRAWTECTTFASLMHTELAARTEILEAELVELLAYLGDGLDAERLRRERTRQREREEREERERCEAVARERAEGERAARQRAIDRWVNILTPVAGLSVLAGVWAAFWPVQPAHSSPTVVPTLVVVGLLLVGAAMGALLTYIRERTRR